MSITNSQMIAGRFLRYARARNRVAWIKAQLAAGRIVQLTTYGSMINDLKFVKGQEAAKRALEIAVLGGHSMLLYGPSGSGKSTLAECATSTSIAMSGNFAAILITASGSLRQQPKFLWTSPSWIGSPSF